MLKWTATVIRQEHVSHDELVRVWEHVDAPHVVKIAKPERYRITFFDPQDTPYDPGLDGMAELWFRDKNHFDTMVGREAASEILADGFNEYADMGKGTWLSVTEHVNLDGPTDRDMTKLVYFVKRRPEIDRSELDKYWLDVHIANVAAAVNRTPSAVRYSVDLVNPKRDMVYDGIAQLTFDSTDARFDDLQGFEPDGFGELVKPLLAARGRELRIVD